MASRRILLAGASGLIGTELASRLTARGDRVHRLVRRSPESSDEIEWDPRLRELDAEVLDGVDVVVNLGGAGIGAKRWTAAYKEELLNSRVDGTTALAGAIVASGGTAHLVNASGIDFYGDRGGEILREGSGTEGREFLTQVCRAWEGAALTAEKAGAPVTLVRTGLVMAQDSDAFKPLVRLGRLGLAGPLGSGKQYWPWITLEDHVGAICHVIDEQVTGPVNLCAPEPAPQRDIARAIGRALSRPAVLPAPRPALRIALGELSQSITASHRAEPARLLETSYSFTHPSLEHGVDWLVHG